MISAPEPNPLAPPARRPWPPILLAAVVAAAVAAGRLASLPWPGRDDPMAHVAGLSLGAAGIALMAWATWTLKRHGTAIRPDAAADVPPQAAIYRGNTDLPAMSGHAYL